MTHICKAKDENKRYSLYAVYGDCLEGAGLFMPHGGYAKVDRNAEFKVGDIVHCTKTPGSITTFIKQVKEINSDSVIVGTSYLDSSKDFEFEAGDILGVVEEVYCKMFNFRRYARTV